jgi:hypothetical protein
MKAYLTGSKAAVLDAWEEGTFAATGYPGTSASDTGEVT